MTVDRFRHRRPQATGAGHDGGQVAGPVGLPFGMCALPIRIALLTRIALMTRMETRALMTLPPRVFIPPEFDLYEFDDDRASLGNEPSRRWFRGWNGLIGAPAEEVTLGWSGGDATVLVGTRGKLVLDTWARLEAAHLLLSGDDVPLPARPASAGAVNRELKRIMSADELWSPTRPLVPGGPAAQAAVLDGFALAYCPVGHGAVFVAAVGIQPAELGIRPVADWTGYDHDATQSFPLGTPHRA